MPEADDSVAAACCARNHPVWPATAIAESALPRNIKGRKSTAPGSSRRVAVRAVRNPGLGGVEDVEVAHGVAMVLPLLV